tara:strand:- start:2001 stop:2390 length:390 start_codon:yes stop_codon:yes gene_type:complete
MRYTGAALLSRQPIRYFGAEKVTDSQARQQPIFPNSLCRLLRRRARTQDRLYRCQLTKQLPVSYYPSTRCGLSSVLSGNAAENSAFCTNSTAHGRNHSQKVTQKGFGFIDTESGEDLFFHSSNLEGVAF